MSAIKEILMDIIALPLVVLALIFLVLYAILEWFIKKLP